MKNFVIPLAGKCGCENWIALLKLFLVAVVEYGEKEEDMELLLELSKLLVLLTMPIEEDEVSLSY